MEDGVAVGEAAVPVRRAAGPVPGVGPQLEVDGGPGSGGEQDRAAVAGALGKPPRERGGGVPAHRGPEHDEIDAIEQGAEHRRQLGGAGPGQQREPGQVDTELGGGREPQTWHARHGGPRSCARCLGQQR
ncbi:hypothetical protein BS329_15785 [Amycolatopsis coloradensis]|uniref:Uncharacterized protein n=1 Tax=Amycolatopsis coloradensis TaxID=76021 RepID=A0A1R0KUA7_9PSEU|nr:hypothetical protein BS329_15785 [Amycolatopsis coloradensis]